MDNLNLADIAAVTKGNEGMFGSNGGMWIFALLILVLIGGGNLWGGSGASQAATLGDVQRVVDNSAIQSDIQRTAYENMAVTKDSAYNNLSEIRDLQAQVNTGFANQATCCCETNRNIDSVKYDMAKMMAETNANTTAQTQKVLDALAADKIASLQAQVSELKTQNMFCGIPRINPYLYTLQPTCGCSCGGSI